MKADKRGSTGRFLRRSLLPALIVAAVAGCATERARVEKNLLADRQTLKNAQGISEHYQVGCPDVLEISLPHRQELSGRYTVHADGRIDLGDYGRLRVDGQPCTEIARLLAEETGTEADQVQVRVLEFRSQYVMLFGEVIGSQRTVDYQGQESVLDLLRRVGGITAGAEPADVYVVRAHLADNGRPEVFHVDLDAIVINRDERTNVRLLPYDQIYVGETKQAQLEKLLPPWLRSIAQGLSDTRPRPQGAANPGISRWVSGPPWHPPAETPEPPRRR